MGFYQLAMYRRQYIRRHDHLLMLRGRHESISTLYQPQRYYYHGRFPDVY